MSRCFPYPPPGFEKKHDPLIESSIKLQKEKDRGKKERKKEKKEKKREKKEKSKDGTVQKEDKKHGHKKRQREERHKFDLKGEYHQLKAKEEEIEHLERSSLTEERGLPSSQYLCDSPDSSQNSSKRIKLDAAEAPVSVLRIRLPSLKQVESINPLLPKQRSLSVLESKSIELPALSTPLLEQRQIAQIDPVVRPCLSVLKQRAVPSTPEKEPCFSGRTETTHAHKETNDCCNDISFFEGFQGSSKSRKKEIKFRDLIVNWHPQPLHIDQGEVEDDQDWLFGCARQQKDITTKDVALESRLPAQLNVLSSWPPRACHHPEADVYLLPFVLPF